MRPTVEIQAPKPLTISLHSAIDLNHCMYINDVQIQQKESEKYLRLHLDSRLIWESHLNQKASQIKQTTREMH